jgi:hypothetical protein
MYGRCSPAQSSLRHDQSGSSGASQLPNISVMPAKLQTGDERTFKSKSLQTAGICLGGFSVILGGAAAGGGSAIGGAVLIICGLAGAASFLRVRVIARRHEIEIRNPLSTVTIRWDDIAQFKMGRHGLLSAVCVVERLDGPASYSFAIQSALAGVGQKELEMVEQLNVLLHVARSA